SSDQMTIKEDADEDLSAGDLGSLGEIRIEEPNQVMTADSAVVSEPRAVDREPGDRPVKKGGAGMGLLIGAGAGLLAASLLWIFGPLDGLRGSLRETIGLSQEKNTASGLHQVGISL